jgi:hypothetical protein
MREVLDPWLRLQLSFFFSRNSRPHLIGKPHEVTSQAIKEKGLAAGALTFPLEAGEKGGQGMESYRRW